mgnify:CR=1 FL=1
MAKGIWKILSKEDVSVDRKWLRVERHTVDTGRAVIKDYYLTFRDPCAIIIAAAPDGVYVYDGQVVDAESGRPDCSCIRPSQ